MKFTRIHFAAVVAVALAAVTTASAQPVPSAAQIRAAKSRIQSIKADVDNLIRIGQGRGGGGEKDDLAVAILNEASGALFLAAQRADESLLATSNDVRLFRFSQCCTQTGLARSRVARARLAALVPPTGFLGIHAQDFTLIVDELFALRQPFPAGVGCP